MTNRESIMVWSLTLFSAWNSSSATAAENGGTVVGTVVLPAAESRARPAARHLGFLKRVANPVVPAKAFDPLPEIVVVLTGGPVDPSDRRPTGLETTFHITGESFERPIVPVVAGDRVQIQNQGTRSPRLHAPDAPDLMPSTPINPRGTRTIGPIGEKPESIEIIDKDSVHLRGRLLVVSHRYFATLDGSGKFKIKGVPPGTWTAKLWRHEGWIKNARATVEVAARKQSASLRIALPARLESTASPKTENK